MFNLIKLWRKMKDIRAGILTHRHGSVRPLSNGCHSHYLMNSWQVWRGWLTADVFFVLIHQPHCTESSPSSWKELMRHASNRRSSTKDKMWNMMGFFFFFFGYQVLNQVFLTATVALNKKRCGLIWCSVRYYLRLNNTWVNYLWISADLTDDVITEVKNGFFLSSYC